jgi:hypothetical protein
MAFSKLVWLSVVTGGVVLSSVDLHANAIVRSGSGFNPGDVQGVVNQFQNDLGGANNGVGGGPFSSGYRTIALDVPDNVASPNLLPLDYFNSTSPRGLAFQSSGHDLHVSADSSNPSMTPVLFGDVDASYSTIFQPFASERVFAVSGSTRTDVEFFLPSDPSTRAWVKGMGVVFSSVDSPVSTSLEFFDDGGVSLGEYFVPAGPTRGLSFLGVSFDGGERVGSVRINSGNAPLGPGVIDGGVVDLVVMSHFVFGEPSVVPEPAFCGLIVLAGCLWSMRRRRRSV